MKHLRLFLAGLSLVGFSAAAPAAIVYDETVTPTKANGDFIPGTGIPADGFAIDTDLDTGVSVALKARSRDTGHPLSHNAGTYVVSNGLAGNATDPWWSFDLQFSPGDDGTLADNFQLELAIDFDPTPGSQWVAFGGTIPMPAALGPVLANPGGGAWSSDDVDFVVADSWHLGYDFWQLIWGTSYDPDATGDYHITLTAKDQFGTQLAQSAITVQVIPEPASLGLLTAGGLLLLKRRRRA